jgi:hypothetical protein
MMIVLYLRTDLRDRGIVEVHRVLRHLSIIELAFIGGRLTYMKFRKRCKKVA